MNRYIDAYKIPYHDLSDGKGKCEVAFLEDIIKVPTADVVEVVRCKNCKYRKKNTFCLHNMRYEDDNGFCSYGERADT